MLNRSSVLAFCAALACALSHASAADAPQTSPHDYTAQDFQQETLANYRKELTATYQAGGRRDAKWDAAATRVLDLFATYSAENDVNEVAQPGFELKPTVSDEDLGKAAQQAIDLGCHDPMILYARALSFANAGFTREARPLLDQAMAGAGTSPYAADEMWRIYKRRRILIREPKVLDADWPQFEKATNAMGVAPFPNNAARRAAALRISQFLQTLKPEQYEPALDRLAATPQDDPWIKSAVTAELELRLALNARGTGFAGTVTPQMWTDWRAHAVKASAAAQAAWKVRPELPEPCVVMMRLAIVDDQADIAAWFDRALAAQPDFAPAYSFRFMSLQPRWGGDTKALLAVGKKAADSGRFDTSIPWEYINAACVVAADKMGGDPQIFTQPEVRKTAAGVISKYAEKYKGTPQEPYFASAQAALAIVNKDSPTAKHALDDIPGNVDSNAFRLFNISAAGSIERIYLESYPNQQLISRYRQAGNRGNYGNAANFLGQAITRGNAAGRDLQILNTLQACSHLMADYSEGKPLSLTEESARPFWISDNPWKIDQGAIVASGREEFLLTSRFYLRDRHYQIHIEFEFLDVDATGGQFLSFAWGLEADRVGWAVMLTGNLPHARVQAPISPGLDSDKDISLEVPDRNTIDITYFDGIPVLKINGKSVPLDFANAQMLPTLAANNTLYLSSNAAVSIRKMTLQHLEAKP